MATQEDDLLQVRGLVKYFPITGGIFPKALDYVKAVDGVDFFVKKGTTFGLVGESGCGKTTLARVILRLLEPTGGDILFEGERICECSPEELRRLRREMQIIFQDPFASLNPTMTVERIISEPLRIYKVGSRRDRKKRVAELINVVGLDRYHLKKYPHQFSGGQQQRIGIARAIALNPKLIICDEPVSALDVSIQSQILNLLQDLQEEFGLTYLFISHNLSVVKHISDWVAVMYLGKIVEMAPVGELFNNPKHPYTEALLSAIPVPDPESSRERVILGGDVPSPINIPKGCRFHTRCQYKTEICAEKEPEFLDLGDNHFVSCHHYERPKHFA